MGKTFPEGPGGCGSRAKPSPVSLGDKRTPCPHHCLGTSHSKHRADQTTATVAVSRRTDGGPRSADWERAVHSHTGTLGLWERLPLNSPMGASALLFGDLASPQSQHHLLLAV